MATPIGSQPPSSSPDEYFNQFEAKIKNHFDNLSELLNQRRSELLQQLATLKAAFYKAEILRNQIIKDLQAMKDSIMKPDIKSNDMVSMMEHMLKTMDDRMQPLKVPTPLPIIEFLGELDIFKDSLNRCELVAMKHDWKCKKIPLVAVKQENTKLAHTLNAGANTINNATKEKKSTDITTVQKAATDEDTMLGALAYNERRKLIYAYDTANNVIKVFDMDGKLMSEFGIEESTGIFDLAFNENCSYLYAVNSKSNDYPNTVYQINVNDYTVLNKSKNMEDITCVDTDSIGDVYVGGGYVLYMYSAELVIKKVLILLCMCIMSIKCLPDSIIVLSTVPYQLSSYSYTGKLQRVIRTEIVNFFLEIQKRDNYSGNSLPHIAMDSGGLLVYPDIFSYAVLITSPNGNLIHKIESNGEQEGKFLYHTGVAVTEKGLLIVTSNSSKYPLQIF